MKLVKTSTSLGKPSTKSSATLNKWKSLSELKPKRLSILGQLCQEKKSVTASRDTPT